MSAGPRRHPAHSPLPHHSPTLSCQMGSHLHHPPHTHTAPHNPHPDYTPTPSPLHHPPHSTTIILLPPHHLPPHHLPPARTQCRCPLWDMLSLPGVSLHTLIPSEARVSQRVPRGCREEERQGAPDRVGAGEWCRGCTVPCLCPLSLLEGGTPCTGHQPLTHRDLG